MKSRKYILKTVFIITLLQISIFSQNDAVQLGSNLNPMRQQTQGALFDYSDPQAVNIKVAVWGWVKYPGKYIIPSYCNVNDLLSYAGGPTDAAHLENLRLIRTEDDSSQVIINIKYSDFMVDLKSTDLTKTLALKPNDVLLVAGEPRYYFRDYLSMGLSAISVVVSLATLIVVYIRK